MASTLVGTVALGLLRTALTSAGAFLVTDGLLSKGDLQTAVGAIATLGVIIWQAYSSHQKAQAVAVVKAVQAHPGLAIVAGSNTASGKPMIVIKAAPTPGTAGSMSGLSVTGH